MRNESDFGPSVTVFYRAEIFHEEGETNLQGIATLPFHGSSTGERYRSALDALLAQVELETDLPRDSIHITVFTPLPEPQVATYGGGE